MSGEKKATVKLQGKTPTGQKPRPLNDVMKGIRKGATPGVVSGDFQREVKLHKEAVQYLDMVDARREEMAEDEKEIARLRNETRRLIAKMQAA